MNIRAILKKLGQTSTGSWHGYLTDTEILVLINDGWRLICNKIFMDNVRGRVASGKIQSHHTYWSKLGKTRLEGQDVKLYNRPRR